MSDNLIDKIVALWSEINPVAGYTSGYTQQLSSLLFQTPENLAAINDKINTIESLLSEITDSDLRDTAAAVLVNQKTQIALARPSGAGPSGTGAGGVYAAADGVFYIVLKEDYNQAWVDSYLNLVVEMINFETNRWSGGSYTVEERKECLDTVTYMNGSLAALQQANPGTATQIDAIKAALTKYQAIFYSAELASSDFATLWAALQQGDQQQGPTQAKGYPDTLQNYYTLQMNADQVEQAAHDWMMIDMPVTIDLAQRIGATLNLAPDADLQTVWDAMSKKYAVDFTTEKMQQVLAACNNYGQQQIIGFTAQDIVKFEPTPEYLVNLVTGGEDFAINYLTDKPFSQLYLTASKNTSLLTMINILVHEASHGFNFVMSARAAASPLLNLNTSLEVPMTEGQAFYREYQYYAGAAALLNRSNLNDAEQAYLNLYGSTQEDQSAAILGAQLETYIWRVIRYIRALCDVRVNGGKQAYTDFIEWAANTTGLSQETLHGECFTFLASPGYAPCYAIGGAFYGDLSTQGYRNKVTQLDFNTQASAMGFHSWPQDKQHMEKIASGNPNASTAAAKGDNHV
ncbi:MAG: hypothetical protein HWE11_13980 [Gammaproteobacteria bacterium]|nr:hypothetical protein [Gammaproteobacteria bacterium]